MPDINVFHIWGRVVRANAKGSARNTKTTASAVSFSAILSCEILDFGQQLSVCVDGFIEGKATE